MSNVVSSPSSGVFRTNQPTFVDVPNLKVTIKTNGGAVLLMLRAARDQGEGGLIGTFNQSTDMSFAFFRFRRGATPLSQMQIGRTGTGASVAAGLTLPCSAVSYLDTPPAGTHTYALQARTTTTSGGPHSVSIERVSLVAVEFDGALETAPAQRSRKTADKKPVSKSTPTKGPVRHRR